MRTLFAGSPGVGHVKPLIRLLQACAKRGHHVAIAVSDTISTDVVPPDIQRYSKNPDAFPTGGPPRGPARTQWWFERNTEMASASYLSCRVAIKSFRPDLVVRDYSERGAYLAAEEAGVPHVTVLTDSENVFPRSLDGESKLVRACRSLIGLPDLSGDDTVIPLRGIAFMHPSFYGDDPSFVRNIRFYRAAPAPSGRRAARPSGSTATGTPPTVLVTMGTTAGVPHEAFLRTALRGLESTGYKVVAAAPDDIAAGLAAEFPWATVHGFVPLTDYLDAADTVVTHGGFGTVTAALERGIPLHITPFHSDQFFNAARITARRFGAALTWERCTPGQIADGITRVMRDPGIRSSTQRFSEELGRLPGIDDCAASLETLVSGVDRAPARSGAA